MERSSVPAVSEVMYKPDFKGELKKTNTSPHQILDLFLSLFRRIDYHILLFRHRCRGPPQPPPPAGAGLLADHVLNLGRDIHESLVEQAEVLVEGHHQLDGVEDVGLDIPVHGSTSTVTYGEVAEGEVAEDLDQLEQTVPPLRINMRSLTIQRVSPVRIDLRRVPPIRIRRLELEAEL